MKRLFSLLLILCTLSSMGQTVIQRAGAANTVNDPRHMASLNSFQPTYSDTVHANQFKGVDSVGAIIYTFDVKGFWYRQHDPKRWVRMTDLVAQTVQNITLVTDSSVYICSGTDNCDTVTFVTNLTDLTSTYLYKEDSLVVCNISACDTVAIPKQIVYLFQNGLTSVDGIQEWGGTLLHNTEVYGGERKILFRAHPIYDYPFGVEMMQRSTDGGGLQYWYHRGSSNPEGQADQNNKVRLNLNYTGALYPTGSGNLPSYFGGKIGYFLGTNTTPEGSYGLKLDEPAAKIGGVFFHTWDTDSTDAITIYGQAAPGTSHVASVNTPATMLPTRIATFHNNRNLTFYGYDSTSRNDGVLTKVLGTDENGNVILGRIAATSVSGGTDQHFANTDLTATANRVHDWAGYRLSIQNASRYLLHATYTAAGNTYNAYYQVNPNGQGHELAAQTSLASGKSLLSKIYLQPGWGTFSAVDSNEATSAISVGPFQDDKVGIALADDSGRLWVTNLPYTSDPVYKVLVRDTVTGKVAYTDGVDTSGRTYYALNGLSARNDSTFKLGGYLDEATRIKGLNTHFVVWDSLSGYYVNTDYSGYTINTTQQDYYEVVQTHKATSTIRNRMYWNTTRMYFYNYLGQYSFELLPQEELSVSHQLLSIDQNDLISRVSSFPEYADQAAAVAAGLDNGDIYHTAGVLKVVYGVLPP